MTGPKRGRPPKLTPEIQEKILNLIRLGNYRETAAAAAGVDARTLRNCLKLGAEGKKPYAEFSRLMDAAESEAESQHVLRVTSASKSDWRAAAWILSRKYTKRWGDKIQVEVQEQIDSFLTVIEDVLGEDAAAKVLAEIVRRERGAEASGDLGEESEAGAEGSGTSAVH